MHYLTTRSWIGALAFTFGVVGGLVHMAVSSLGSQPWPSRNPFRRAVVGHSKREIARLLGPPPAAAAGTGAASTYWLADAWYYPFDRRRRTAVAVLFNRDRAVGVEFIPAL